MKNFLAAALLVSASSLAFAQAPTPYAPQEFNFSGLESTVGEAYGLVESVQPAQPKEPIHADVFEHAVQPGAAKELVIRLDDGAGVSIVQDAPAHLEPGQRVYVRPRGAHVRAEPADLAP